jgi:protein-disulfide isomerase
MSRFVKTLATAALIPALAMTASATYAGSFTAAQQKDIQGIIGSYLDSNPQVIINALQGFQKKQMADAEQTIKNTQKDAGQFVKALFHTTNDPVGGNPNGAVTIVEFFDYQCPHCVDMFPVLTDTIKNNPDVRIIFKEFPIRGAMSDFASRAALAANMQGKYMAFHDALMQTKQPYTQEAIMAAAKSVGLNIEKLTKDMNSPEVSTQLKANMKLGQDLKLLGTPAFFIGKTDASTSTSINYVPGQINQAQMQDFIKKSS